MLPAVGQCVEHHQPAALRGAEPMAHEVRANEAGAAGDQQIMRLEVHPTSSLKWCRQCRAGVGTASRAESVFKTLKAGRSAGVG